MIIKMKRILAIVATLGMAFTTQAQTTTTSGSTGGTTTGTSTVIKQNKTLRLGTAPAGAGILDINGTTIDGTTWIVVATMEENYDSVYVPAHGFSTDDVVLVSTGPVVSASTSLSTHDCFAASLLALFCAACASV